MTVNTTVNTARRAVTLTMYGLVSALVVSGGSAYALTTGGSAGKDVAVEREQAKWKPGDPVSSEIADAATLAGVPAAPAEAPPAAAVGR